MRAWRRMVDILDTVGAVCLLLTIILFIIMCATGWAYAAEPECDTQLVLAVDVSGSISDQRFALQRDGLATAVADGKVIRAAVSGPRHCTAMALIQWSDTPVTVIPMVKVDGQESALVLAGLIAQMPRTSAGTTALFAAIKAARTLFTCEDCRRKIDVSGDGKDNAQGSHQIVTDLENEEITINGLAIVADEPDVANWYRENVRTKDGFVITAASDAEFGAAMKWKLEDETAFVERPRRQLAGR